MEINKELGPFKIKIELDGFTPEMEEYVNSQIGVKIKNMHYLGVPLLKTFYPRSTYRVGANNICNWIHRALQYLQFYHEEDT